ncbi:MAG: sulfatase-like hydrolase/transferase [Verrucomicrobiota bacterium]
MRHLPKWLTHTRLAPVLSVLALLSSTAPIEEARATPPNVLLILADDLGYADIGAYGYADDIATPHIDQLAKNGARFTHGYATHPFCSPSRAGLMAGMYQHRFGFETNSGPELYAAPNFGLPKHVPTLAEKLNAAGYTTGMIGKWHIGFREGLRPHERGFDSFYGFLSGARSFYPDPNGNSPLLRNDTVIKKEPAYLTDAFADEAVAFIQDNQDHPWFLYLAFNAVHTPMEATDEYEARFPHITDPKRRTLAGMLAAMDDAVGRIMEEVHTTDAENNTLILFYSDNGGIPPKNASLNGPLRGMKGATYEGGIRVPFIAQWKGTIPEGLVYDQPAMGFDCHATALAAAGLPLDNGDAPALDGVNLIPFLTGKEMGPPHNELVWRADKQQGLRTGKWKMVKQAREDPQLFNLDADPGETNNLANTHPEKLAQLTNAFDKWSNQMMEPQWIRQDRDNAEPGGKLKEVAETRNRRSPSTAQLREVFARADQNNDGKLTREEYPRPENFPQVDTNDDGVVTLEEVRARSAGQDQRRIQRDTLPAGKTLQISIDEQIPTDPILEQSLADWFTSFDKNNDHFITTDEMDARSLRGGDRNADRRISRAEAQRYFRDLQATAAARANPDIYVPWSKAENQTRLRRAKSGDPLLNLEFTRDLPTGEKDPNGNLITGTECLHLEAHKGMLFATLSGWNHDKNRAPWPGASVAVKKSADAPWEIEQNFGKDSGRAGSLHSVSFTTLADGEKLDAPTPILLCGIGGRSDAGKIVVWARNNAVATWVKTTAGEHEGPASPEVRVLFDHVDSVTGIHHVFAAASNGMLFRGAYHPATEGKIIWHPEPELSGRERRFMAAAKVDDTVYITIDLEPTNPENGGLFKRIDGENPRWERVTGWQWSHPNPHHLRPWFGMRGLTALGDGTLLGAREHPGAIDRIHPNAPAKKRNTVEFDVRSALLDTWNHPPENPGGMAIIAYNDMLPLTHPTTGQETHLISLGTRHPEGGTLRDPNPLGASAWYLVRYNATQYGLGRIPHPGDGTLRATRTICASPFPEEKNRVWYFAGFDAFGGPSHLNTAWIARGEMPDN